MVRRFIATAAGYIASHPKTEIAILYLLGVVVMIAVAVTGASDTHEEPL